MRDKIFRFGPWITGLVLLFVGVPWSAGQERGDEPTVSRATELSKLIAIVRDARLQDTDPARVVQAIQRLGEMRATEAVDDLAGLLTFRKWLPWEKDPSQPKIEVHLITDRERYPAILALALIGPPSLPALMKVIEAHESSSTETRNAMETIILMARDKRPEYVARLKHEAAIAPSSEGSQRLLKAAETLEKSKR